MEIDKSEIGKNKVLGNWVYYLKNGGGIHGKIKNWKDGDPEREPAFAYIYRKEVKPEMVVIDIGANIGCYSLIAAQIMKGEGRVYAIEPDPRNAKLLEKAVIKNTYGIKIYNMAISDGVGEVNFYLSKATNLSSMIRTEHSDEQIKVNTTTLSKFAWDRRILKYGLPVFVRMDIEGHEVEALKGGVRFFQKDFPCKLFLEVHPRFYSEEHSLENQLKFLITRGFTTRYVISAAVAIPELFQRLNYKPVKIFDCGRFERGLYLDIKDKDMLRFSCHTHTQLFNEEMIKRSGEESSDKIVRAVMLERS